MVEVGIHFGILAMAWARNLDLEMFVHKLLFPAAFLEVTLDPNGASRMFKLVPLKWKASEAEPAAMAASTGMRLKKFWCMVEC